MAIIFHSLYFNNMILIFQPNWKSRIKYHSKEQYFCLWQERIRSARRDRIACHRTLKMAKNKVCSSLCAFWSSLILRWIYPQTFLAHVTLQGLLLSVGRTRVLSQLSQVVLFPFAKKRGNQMCQDTPSAYCIYFRVRLAVTKTITFHLNRCRFKM